MSTSPLYIFDQNPISTVAERSKSSYASSVDLISLERLHLCMGTTSSALQNVSRCIGQETLKTILSTLQSVISCMFIVEVKPREGLIQITFNT